MLAIDHAPWDEWCGIERSDRPPYKVAGAFDHAGSEKLRCATLEHDPRPHPCCYNFSALLHKLREADRALCAVLLSE